MRCESRDTSPPGKTSPPVLDDRRRLRALFDAHGQQVHRRALRLLGNPADADEALQEVFVRAAHNIDDLRSGEVVRWLYRTTGVCVADFERPPMPDAPPPPPPMRD